jgi:HEPN domain-containing protein
MPGLKDWLRKASSDLRLATKSIGDDETLDPAVYLTHQCAEKSLKAVFVLNGKTIPKTHDLDILLDNCTQLNWEFILLKNECKLLRSYGFDSRYPNDTFRVNQKDLAEAIDMAYRIFDFVKSKALNNQKKP